MLKKLSIFASVIVMAFIITACGDNSSSQPDDSSPQSSNEQATEISTEDYQTVKSDKKLNDRGLADNIDDGAILHTWCWSFNTIKDNMKDISDAGFSAIQTSPINQCKVGDGGGMQLQDDENKENDGKWYYHYQPTDYVIGNYQLGTEEEFKEMCAEAEKYGVKVIVDVVLNHTTSDRSAISDNIKNLKNPFHNFGDIKSYASREEVTQGNLLGLVDLNTQDKEVQEYLLSYLKNCVEDGASGFRYDAAKHIELASDDGDFAGDFWNVITNNGAKFQYGEILQGGSDRISEYAKKVNVTASKYGENIRYAIANGDLSVGAIKNYGVNGIDEAKLVTWVESHDNYCNDGTWIQLDENLIKHGWAVIAARSGGTPLFYSRPMGASSDDQWGNNKIGEAGSDFYKDDEVVWVNKFRNAMIGLNETLSNPMDNDAVIMIERGDKGAVFVSVDDSDLKLENVETVLKDGTYKDKISSDEFTVKDGKIKGTVKAGQIAVLYN